MFRQTLHRKSGALSGGLPELPAGPPLVEGELTLLDAILREHGELWLIGPLNDDVEMIELGTVGIERWRAEPFHTRRLGDVGVLYVPSDGGFGPLFALAVDLRARRLIDARWVELPANGSRTLAPATVEFLDRALREHGDFGTAGDVSAGLRALARDANMQLQLHERAADYAIHVSPRDGHGHWLRFDVAKDSGRIGACAAGHYVQPDR
jgi:hypothetical protein